MPDTSVTRGDLHAPQTWEQDFDAYALPIDRTQATYDPGSDSFHVFAPMHAEVFAPELTPAEEREVRIKQAALRLVAGLETRSLRELAVELGCTHTAIDNRVRFICERLNLRKYHVSDATRQRQREARQRQLAAATQP